MSPRILATRDAGWRSPSRTGAGYVRLRGVRPECALYDFVVRMDETRTLVRVRRGRHNRFAVSEIEYHCSSEIAGRDTLQ
jgi:hypothetical protein